MTCIEVMFELQSVRSVGGGALDGGASIRVGLCSSVLAVCGCVLSVCFYMQEINPDETLRRACVCVCVRLQ